MGLALFITCSTSLLAQDIHRETAKRDFRMGTGLSLLGTGDLWAIQVESEVNYKLLPHMAVAGAVTLGSSPFLSEESTTFVQLNANGFLSPFRNDRFIDFRVGGGLSYYVINEMRSRDVWYYDSDILYRFSETSVLRHALGANIIIETTLQLTENLLLGAKAFTQPYLNGDINTGVMGKIGVRF